MSVYLPRYSPNIKEETARFPRLFLGTEPPFALGGVLGRKISAGDIYDPGHGRRLQIRDNWRNIIGYIERDGDITDARRRKVEKIELVPK